VFLRRNWSIVFGLDALDTENAPMCSASSSAEGDVRRLGTTTVVSKQLPVSGSATFLGTMRVLTFGMRDMGARSVNDRSLRLATSQTR
jgi:hypothetical protein